MQRYFKQYCKYVYCIEINEQQCRQHKRHTQNKAGYLKQYYKNPNCNKD